MMRQTGTPLDELDTPSLFHLLGSAWYAQLKVSGGEAHYIAPAQEIGKREFEYLIPLLRADMNTPFEFGVVDTVNTTIRKFACWQMPAPVVAALALKHLTA